MNKAALILGFAISLACAGDSIAAGASNVRALGSSRSGTVDAGALARAKGKYASVLQIANRFNGSYQSSIDPNRVLLINNLMRGDALGLTEASQAASLEEALAVASSAAVRKSNTLNTVTHRTLAAATPSVVALADTLGDAADDLVYTPITPCRVLDTRNYNSATPLADGSFTTFTLNGGAAQGGSGCAVYTGANPAAAAMNVTVEQTGLGSSGTYGFLAIVPTYTVGDPLVSWMNYTGGGTTIANQGVASINQTDGSFVVLVQNSSQVIIDVFGYFRAPGSIPSTTTLVGLFTTVVSAVPLGVPSSNSSSHGTVSDTLTCPADHPLALSGSYTANDYRVYAYVSSIATVTTTNDSWTFSWENTNNNAAQVTYSVLCSK